MPFPPLPIRDLQEILAATAPLWEQVRGERLFLTGGTGFFGCWLVESFLHCNRELKLDARVTVLTRDPEAFFRKVPHLRSEGALTLHPGDVRDFSFTEGDYGFVIHAATEASAKQLAEQPHEMLSTILAGTERVLSFASQAATRKLLLTSSGAVYGPQPGDLSHVPEEYNGAPDSLLPGSIYGEGKRAAELLCALAAQTGLEAKIARCFAFVGPHLPLEAHFAAGNFIADVLHGRPISIASDGTTLRSYLYAADLAIWLWTMLFEAPSLRAYNVGSERAVSIAELAQTAASLSNPALNVSVAQAPTPGRPPAQYVPSTARAQRELGLRESVPLAEALRRTLDWHNTSVRPLQGSRKQ
jgi:nucleoside-diphosphate-sugar epimerase